MNKERCLLFTSCHFKCHINTFAYVDFFSVFEIEYVYNGLIKCMSSTR